MANNINSISGENGQSSDVLIIGGGFAGIAAARCLDKDCSVTVLERNDHLGGHVESIPVELDGKVIQADLGSQFFSPVTHPNYVRLLGELGMLDENTDGHPLVVKRFADMTFFRHGDQTPLFMAPVFVRKLTPLFKLWNYKGLGTFSILRKAGRALENSVGETDLTVGQWVESLPIRPEHKHTIALGLFAAMNGTSFSDTSDLSLREGVYFFSRNLNANPLTTIYYYTCRLGLAEVIKRLVAATSGTEYYTSQNIISIERVNGRYQVLTHDGSLFEAPHLIMACPPYSSMDLLAGMPGNNKRRRILSQFRYFDTRIVLHRDPCYMPIHRKHWSIYNCEVTKNRCEASIWYSRILGYRDNLFKSWATDRVKDPKELIAERLFKHPVIDRNFVKAQHELDKIQGKDNIWFAGSYTRHVDSQDTALESANYIAESLRRSIHILQAEIA